MRSGENFALPDCTVNPIFACRIRDYRSMLSSYQGTQKIRIELRIEKTKINDKCAQCMTISNWQLAVGSWQKNALCSLCPLWLCGYFFHFFECRLPFRNASVSSHIVTGTHKNVTVPSHITTVPGQFAAIPNQFGKCARCMTL